MNIEVKIGRDKFKGKGTTYLTTVRIVFVCDKPTPQFQSFDIPLAHLYNEAFKQPIFGANNIYGKVEPLFGLIPQDAEFHIYFMEGGCHTFLPLFYGTVDEIRKNQHRGVQEKFKQQIQSG